MRLTPLVCLLPNPRIRPEPVDLNIAHVRDLPSRSVIDLGAVADGHNGLGICQRYEVRVKHGRGPPRALCRCGVLLRKINVVTIGFE